MLFFNSSMPRACSTLLQNLLSQRPDVDVTGTDGSLELLYAAKGNFASDPTFKAMGQEKALAAWRGFCRGGLEAYAAAISSKENLCIKSRGIGIHYDWYSAFMGQPIKVICLVRDLRAILSSMEKIYRKSSETHSNRISHANMSGTTTAKRTIDLLHSQPVGLALERFHDMLLRGILDKCLVVRAEDLSSNTQQEMNRISHYLGLPTYTHDTRNVPCTVQEDDDAYGMGVALHQTRPSVTPLAADFQDILGVGLCEDINNRVGWYQKTFGYIQ